ncbi:serine/threonine-protein kinase [Actinacidiphila bryophytorum]|uniref:serine/threonine-protein kinase n=1 Tax=Actinacidiphila bryophytorum TaxID=1436133 RepID=UPI002176E34C|nr:serine/threonine-protein kinase [Actinacidiphila bryophytorum]UWE10635.1 serine/threonine protein kinase [Actinacidiphila bryophytorum]
MGQGHQSAARRPLLREGGTVGAGYLVERYLGQGAYAEVYRVRHPYLGRQAMKVFRQVADRATVDALLAEAVLLSRLGHPNIVRVFDAGTTPTATGERAYFTMEYVAGGTLARFMDGWLERTGHVPVAAAERVLHQVSSGLALAHAAQPPIVHRDITPHNILVGLDGDGGQPIRARLSDFGLATRTDPRTGLASAQGVLAFKPPETLLGFRGDSRSGDVWALGVVGYLLLTGRLPYPRGLAGWMTGSHRRAPPPPPGELNPDVDQELERIVLDALAVDRELRTPDAGVLAGRFERRAERMGGGRPPPGTGSGGSGTSGGVGKGAGRR